MANRSDTNHRERVLFLPKSLFLSTLSWRHCLLARPPSAPPPPATCSRASSSRSHRVSFVSTPRNIALLPVAPALAPLVDFVVLPLLCVDGLPAAAESTNDVPFDKFELHRKAFDGLAAPFSAFIDVVCAEGGKKPDWVIVDSFHHWAAAAAIDHNVPCAMLLLCPANIFAAFTGQRQQEATREGRPAAAPRFETELTKILYTTAGASGISISQSFFLTLQSRNIVAMRTCVELEPEALPRLPALYGKPVIPFSLLPPSSWSQRPECATDGREKGRDAGAKKRKRRIMYTWMPRQRNMYMWTLRHPKSGWFRARG